MATPPRFLEILRAFAAVDSEFIVVGGVAAMLHGVPTSTLGLGLVYRRTDDNIDRVVRALSRLETVGREPAGRNTVPRSSHLTGAGHHQLMTFHGPVDLRDSIGGLSYEDLLARSSEVYLGGLGLRVPDVPTLFDIEERAGEAQDEFLLEVLREALSD